MISPQHHRDSLAPSHVGKLVSPLGIASHGADGDQIRAAKIAGNRIDRFVNQCDVGIQFRRDKRSQRGQRGCGIGVLGVCLVPPFAVVETERVGGNQ